MHGMGRVAEIGDPASLAAAILQILDEVEKFKGNPTEVARQYDPDTVAAEYEKLFEKLIRKKR
jgi:glycosyltransferase involved in cell wall biosynthesis